MYRGNRHEVEIAGKTFWVDSNQEEALIRWLEDNGFKDRWRRLDHGLTVGKYNYTPDLELSVQFDGMTHRALVESKPTVSEFTEYISERMRGVAKHYFCDILLLYVHDDNKWYRIDRKTGELGGFNPEPGQIPIEKLYRPMTKKGRQVYQHQYRKRLELGKVTATLIADILEAFVVAILTPPPSKRRRRRRRR